MSITYKSGGVNRQYSGSAVVIKDAAETLHFFEASAEKNIGISGADTVSADSGTETYTVVGAGSLGVSFAWGVNSPFSISGGVLTIPANSDGATANITLSFDGTTVASKAVTVTAAAPATYDITIPTVTGATITVKVNGAAYTSGKLTHNDAVSIKIEAKTNYNITSSSVTMGGQPVTGSNGEYTISSVTGAVVISATAESERVETTDSGVVSSVTSTRNLECTMANKKFSSVRKIDVQGTTKSTSGWIVYSATFENANGSFVLTDVLLQNNVTLDASTSLSGNPLTNVAYKTKDGISAPTIDNIGEKTKVILPCMSGVWGTYNATNIDYQTGSAGAYTVTLTGYEA